MLLDAVGASESGAQMSTATTAEPRRRPRRSPRSPTPPSYRRNWTGCCNRARGTAGWPAATSSRSDIWATRRRRRAPSPRSTGCDGRYRDRANVLDDGRIQLLGRDSVTINSGGEKIFVEEVERAVAAHPGVYDVVVVGRPSERWGSEVVAIVQLADGASATDEELVEVCRNAIARYKIPKAFIRTPKVVRSPAGKADYRWAKELAAEGIRSE
jgi:fatty-acyl-CoA synthase